MAIWRVGLCLLAVTAAVQAQEESLRWRFTAGESQLYRMTQAAHLDLRLSPESDVVTEVRREFDFRWSVAAVEEDGSASIVVQVTRAALRVVGPGGQETEYDTQNDEQPHGYAATLAPLFKTLLESEIKARMNTRGELSELQIPDDLQIVLSSKPAGKALGHLGSEDDFRSLLQLGLPVLPESESFAVGQQWEEERQLANAPLGSAETRNVYRWENVKEQEGERLAVIVPTISASLIDAVAGVEKDLITEQKTTGEILFDLTSGRPQSSQIELQLQLESDGDEQPVRSTLVHTVSFGQLDESATP